MPPETKDRVNRPVDWLNKFALAAAARGLYVNLDSDGEINVQWVQPFFVDVNNTQVLNGTLAYLRDITNQNDTARVTPTPLASGLLDSLSGLVTNSRGMLYDPVGATWRAANGDRAIKLTSAVNTASIYNLNPQSTVGLCHSLEIYMLCSGAGTATLTVEVSCDNITFITIDSIAAAASTVLRYNTVAAVGATIALSPVSFPYIKITAGASGAGTTTTLHVAMK